MAYDPEYNEQLDDLLDKALAFVESLHERLDDLEGRHGRTDALSVPNPPHGSGGLDSRTDAVKPYDPIWTGPDPQPKKRQGLRQLVWGAGHERLYYR